MKALLFCALFFSAGLAAQNDNYTPALIKKAGIKTAVDKRSFVADPSMTFGADSVVTSFDNDGNVVKEQSFYSDTTQNSVTTYTYVKGHVKKAVVKQPAYNMTTNTVDYYYTGDRLDSTVIDGMALHMTSVYKYQSPGKDTAVLNYSKKHQLISKQTSTWGASGRSSVIVRNISEGKNKVLGSATMTYNTAGQLEKNVSVNFYGEQMTYEYTYSGDLLIQCDTKKDSKLTETHTFSYRK